MVKQGNVVDLDKVRAAHNRMKLKQATGLYWERPLLSLVNPKTRASGQAQATSPANQNLTVKTYYITDIVRKSATG